MSTLTALMLATPLFGMQLSVDPAVLELPDVSSAVSAPQAAFSVQTLPALKLEQKGELTTADLIRKRNKLKNVHKWLGITTWSLMTITLVSGYIQFYNKYGWWDPVGDTPCVTGNAVLGQNNCTGQPVWHATFVALTTATYFATFAISFTMPDPLKVSEGNSKFARKLRTHKKLRWATFSGMVAQILLGVVIANGHRFGLDRANNYKALRALATTHLAIGTATWGTMTAAGALMLF